MDALAHQKPLVQPAAFRLVHVLIAVLPLIVFFSGMAMTPYLVLLAGGLLIAAPAALSEDPERRRGLALICALLLTWPVLSAAWSIAPRESLIMAAKTVTIVAVGVVGFLSVRSTALTRPVVDGFIASVGVVAVLVLMEKLPGGGVIHLRYPDPADYEKFMVVHINRGLCALSVLIWPMVLAGRARGRAHLGLFLPLIAAVPVAVMHSLSAKMALVLGIATYAVVQRWPRALKALQVAIPLCLLLWPAVFAAAYKPVFANPAVYDRLPNSSQARIDIWKFAFDHIRERPLLGWGMEASRSIPGGNDTYMNGTRTYLPLHPHNGVLQVLLEQGVVGLVLTIAAIWLALAALRRHENAEMRAAGAATLVAYLMIGFAAFGMWQTWWIATGWIAAMLWRAAYSPRPA
jgi:O-antigen ligase